MPNLEYDDTYSPTARFQNLRLLCSIVAQEDLEFIQLDVKGAYLYWTLDHDIYMRLPPNGGRGEFGPNGRSLVAHLRKFIYGLKQSGRCWWKKLDEVLTRLGFKHPQGDWGMYHLKCGEDVIYIFLYVDDMAVAFKGETWSKIYENLKQEFKLTGGEDVEYLLGINTHRNRPSKTLHLSMSTYIEQTLAHYNMSECNSVSTPLPENILLTGDGSSLKRPIKEGPS